jgi:exopolyphosphatase / guanosine-5'-triphosphate,3'-diphosphate pyrophosphatase
MASSTRRFVLFLTLGFALGGCGTTERGATEQGAADRSDGCKARRAAFDIGSGTTKVKVADIDLCAKTVTAIHFAEETPVFYGVDVAHDAEPSFQPATMDIGFRALADFKASAEQYRPEAYAAVATAAFRRAKNAEAFVDRIEGELGIAVNLIAQTQEARLGFMGAVRKAAVDPAGAVVWDVGGSSMQMTALGPQGHLVIYEGALASGQMREHMMHRVQGKNRDAASPNPVTEEQAELARAYAEAYARQNVPQAIQDKLAHPDTVVIGIGALKYYGDRPAHHDGAVCSQRVLSVRLAEIFDKSDGEIGGDYAATQVSDRVLLEAFMRGLGIDEVRLVDIDLTDGLLFEPEYWQPAAEG